MFLCFLFLLHDKKKINHKRTSQKKKKERKATKQKQHPVVGVVTKQGEVYLCDITKVILRTESLVHTS